MISLLLYPAALMSARSNHAKARNAATKAPSNQVSRTSGSDTSRASATEARRNIGRSFAN